MLADGTVVRGRGDRRRAAAAGWPRARSCSTRCSPATRRCCPTRATPARSSPSPTRTSATTAPTPPTTRAASPFCRGVVVRDLARRRVELARRRRPRRLPATPRRPRHRRDRHPPPHPPHPRRRRHARRVRHGRRRRRLKAAAVDEPGTDGVDLVATVTTAEPYTVGDGPRRVVAYDFGIKTTILRHLVASWPPSRWCRRRRRPPTCWPDSPTACSSRTARAIPATVPYAIEAIGACSARCRSSASASATSCWAPPSAARIEKLPFGHHGGNHPVRHLATGKVEITSQNHNFAVVADSLAGVAELTHVNLNDGVCEGLRVLDAPAFSVQHHPEAGPGPHDSRLPVRPVRRARWTGAAMPKRDRHRIDPADRLRADRHRPGVRVRLLGHPGVPRAPRRRATGSSSPTRTRRRS